MRTLLKVVFSLVLLGLVLSQVDLEALVANVARADPLLYLAALGVMLGRTAIAALRWQRLLASKEKFLSLGKLTRFYLVGAFYNLILPTVLGGDVVRIFLARRATNDTKEAVSSVLVERLMGFLALLSIATVALPIAASRIDEPRLLVLTPLLLVVLGLVTIVLLSRRARRLWTLPFFREGRRKRLGEKLERLHASLGAYRDGRGTLLVAFLLSAAYQVVGIFGIWLTGRSIGMETAFLWYLVFVPLISVVMMIPLSISGLGLREGAFVYFFALVGVPKEQALLLSLLFFSQSVVLGLLGGLLNLGGSLLRRDDLTA